MVTNYLVIETFAFLQKLKLRERKKNFLAIIYIDQLIAFAIYNHYCHFHVLYSSVFRLYR